MKPVELYCNTHTALTHYSVTCTLHYIENLLHYIDYYTRTTITVIHYILYIHYSGTYTIGKHIHYIHYWKVQVYIHYSENLKLWYITVYYYTVSVETIPSEPYCMIYYSGLYWASG
jgi:hypothetical protein